MHWFFFTTSFNTNVNTLGEKIWQQVRLWRDVRILSSDTIFTFFFFLVSRTIFWFSELYLANAKRFRSGEMGIDSYFIFNTIILIFVENM